jgi:hypothetical protein
MNMKGHILAALREELSEWEALLAGLSEAQITASLAPSHSHWSIKDVIAHVMAWQQRSIARLEAAQLNREPQFPQWMPSTDADIENSVDHVNASIYEAFRAQSWATVHQTWRAGFAHFLQLAEGIAERDLLDSNQYAWMNGHALAAVLLGSYDHHREHLETTRDWLQAQGIRTSSQ